MSTAAELLLARADDDRPALLFEDRSWTYRQLVDEGRRRMALQAQLPLPSGDDGRPLHVGILLDNSPEYVFWLAAAALSGSVLVGINSTYRGEQLGQLISHTDCDVVITSTEHLPLLEGLDDVVHPDRLLVVDGSEYRAEVERTEPVPPRPVTDDDLFLLIFTSGSTGMPKAVRCTQGRFARTGAHVANLTQVRSEEDVVYCPLPFFHSASLFSGWAGALTGAVPIANAGAVLGVGDVARPAPARVHRAHLHRQGPELHPVGARVARRRRHPPAPRSRQRGVVVGHQAVRAALRLHRAGLLRFDRGHDHHPSRPVDARRGPRCRRRHRQDRRPRHLEGVPPVRVGTDGRLANLEDAVGEIVETTPGAGFEGYYKNPVATTTRFRHGWYWSGDLGYRDAEGWFYFAGRSNEWLRVDGENFAAAPVEAIVSRHPSFRSVAVYAVPDDPIGDRVMVALELDPGSSFDPATFDEFLAAQPDLGPKWVPAFVRTTAELPKLASMKIDKTTLRRAAWTADDVYWRPAKGESLRPLSTADRRRLDRLLKGPAG